MKRVLLIAAIIGLFMATTMDLQARHRRNDLSRFGRSGISFTLHRQIPLSNQYNRYNQYPNYRSYNQYPNYQRYNQYPNYQRYNQYNRYNQYPNYQGRRVDREIRSNEKRIWKLEKRLDRLGRYEGNYGEIRELEQEINWLQSRNDYLRSQLY